MQEAEKKSVIAIVTGFIAIVKLLRIEKELKHIEVHRQAVSMAWQTLVQSYGISADDFSGAVNQGIAYANKNHEEPYRFFLKRLECWQLSGSYLGDFTALLLMYLRICEEYEPSDIVKKYSDDIEITLHEQFEVSDEIIKQTKKIINELFLQAKEELLKLHPIMEN